MPSDTSARFHIKRGVKQGCPISPSLFILATEMLAILIKNSIIESINVFISQLTDTTLFLKSIDQVPKAIKRVNHFSKFSGLKLNINKCEIMTVHENSLKVAHYIPIKTCVKYLGKHIKDGGIREKLNIWNRWNYS